MFKTAIDSYVDALILELALNTLNEYKNKNDFNTKILLLSTDKTQNILAIQHNIQPVLTISNFISYVKLCSLNSIYTTKPKRSETLKNFLVFLFFVFCFYINTVIGLIGLGTVCSWIFFTKIKQNNIFNEFNKNDESDDELIDDIINERDFMKYDWITFGNFDDFLFAEQQIGII